MIGAVAGASCCCVGSSFNWIEVRRFRCLVQGHAHAHAENEENHALNRPHRLGVEAVGVAVEVAVEVAVAVVSDSDLIFCTG